MDLAISGDGSWVFVGRRGAPLGSNPARWTDLVRKACGLDFTLHDLAAGYQPEGGEALRSDARERSVGS